MIDSHCHLGMLGSEEELAVLLRQAAEAGIERVVDIGLDVASSAAALERAERISTSEFQVGVAVGWHPHQGRAPHADELREMEALCRHPRTVAVGEIGLDYHWTDHHSAAPAIQAGAFDAMLALAEAEGLPVVIHNREAGEDVLRHLEARQPVGVVMHCWTGSLDFAERCLRLGAHLSFAGPLTYPRAEEIRAVATAAPEDRVLSETDSPFLPPQGHRGRANHPALMAVTVARLAEIRGMALERMAGITSANALRAFPKLGLL